MNADDSLILFINDQNADATPSTKEKWRQLRTLSKTFAVPSIKECVECIAGLPTVYETINARLSESKRRTVILAGLWFEKSISLIALRLIEDGFDVFICVDACEIDDKQFEEVYRQRISTFMGVLTTVQQVDYEFISTKSCSSS